MYNYSQLTTDINQYIDTMPYPATPDGLYAPIRYVLSLGGKRIRPALMLMAYNLYHDNPHCIMPQAIALETYHNFTLLHDDLMDRADMRRGNPTVHRKWDENTAILSGDTMLIMAYRIFIQDTSNPYIMQAMHTFNDATLGVYEGQRYDMEFEKRNDVNTNEYMEMIRLKTSLLLACALKIGAQLAGATNTDTSHLYDFGEKMGLAFQLQDDLLDVYGDPATFGKNTGGDILCNKKTFMLLKTQEMASPAERRQLQQWLDDTQSDPTEKIKAVTAIYDHVGIRQVCQEKIEHIFTQSLKSLDQVGVDDERKTQLRDIAHQLLKRKK